MLSIGDMGKKKISAILISLLLLLITFIALSNLIGRSTDELILVEKGVVDLSAVDFDHTEPMKLIGEWEFYPNELISPEDFNEEVYKPNYVQVPSSWDKYNLDQWEGASLGTGTFRMKVRVNEDDDRIYGLKTSIIRMATGVFVDGKNVGQSGEHEIDSYAAKNEPIEAVFKPDSDTIEIIIHVSNYSYDPGGITHSIYFGDSQAIMNLKQKRVSYDWIVISGLLVVSIYIMGLFCTILFINRRKEYHLLFFALGLLSNAGYRISHGERILYDLFPNMNYDTFFYFQTIPVLLAGISIILYTYFLFRDLSSPKMAKVVCLISLVLIVRILILPTVPVSTTMFIQSMVSTFTVIYAVYILLLAAMNKREGYLFLVIGAIGLVFELTMMTLNAYGYVDIDVLFPFQPFIFIISQVFLHSVMFSNAEKKVKILSEKVIRANKMKDEFLAKTTHEFKTPLNGIINISQSVLDDSNIGEQEKQDIAIVVNVAKRLSRMVSDILDISQYEYGNMNLQCKNVDVRTTLEVVLRVIDFTKSSESIQIINNIPDNLLLVHADQDRLKQVFYNLIDNALKYTDDGIITIGAKEKGSFVDIWVEDTGKGIDSKEIKQILKPFYQIKNTDESYIEGHGLGLSIVKQLIELQGGKLEIESVIGKGTRVKFSLPRGSDKKSQSKEPVQLPLDEAFIETPYMSHLPGAYTILVVDDNYVGLKTVIAILKEDYRIIAVDSGYKALEVIESEEKIDLVILDLMMPELSGYDVCKIIRENYSVTELPVLMLTAAIQTNDKIAAYEAGANDFLNKPFDLTQLRLRVKSLITIKESAKTAVEMGIAFLMSQIKPHFLYNALNAIAGLCFSDSEKAGELILEMATYLRMNLDANNTNKLISIKKELEFTEAYITIQKARFEDKIHYECEVNTELDFMIPPLTIEPLVENALKYSNLASEEGIKVKVTILREGSTIFIQVKDNGPGMSKQTIQDVFQGNTKGLGLSNVNRRLHHLYGKGLEINNHEEGGLKIQFKMRVS